MNEEELNTQYICNKTLLDKDDELVPIILEMIKDSYKSGLCQSEFNNTMRLIEENEHLRIQIRVRENVCDRLAGNWNLLKRYCYEAGNDENTKLNSLNVLDKMQELERDNSNEIENKIKTSIEQEKLENELSHKKYELENLNEEKAKENQELKERLERINNYLDKYYSMENQYWFDHIRDIVEDR